MRLRITALATACALGLFTAIAIAGVETSIKGTTVDPDPTFTTATYSGKVKSEDPDCRKGRKVKVVHLSTPPFTIGETETDEKGNWELDGPLPPGPGERISVTVKKRKPCNKAKRTYEVGDVVDAEFSSSR
jgi:hypothetical protein